VQHSCQASPDGYGGSCTIKYTPIRFSKLDNKFDVEKYLYSLHGSKPISGAYIFNSMDPASGSFDFTVMNNKTISQDQDIKVLLNFISEALVRTLSLGQVKALTLSGLRDFPQYAYSINLKDAVDPVRYITLLKECLF
jgi:hypothetical protein